MAHYNRTSGLSCKSFVISNSQRVYVTDGRVPLGLGLRLLADEPVHPCQRIPAYDDEGRPITKRDLMRDGKKSPQPHISFVLSFLQELQAGEVGLLRGVGQAFQFHGHDFCRSQAIHLRCTFRVYSPSRDSERYGSNCIQSSPPQYMCLPIPSTSFTISQRFILHRLSQQFILHHLSQRFILHNYPSTSLSTIYPSTHLCATSDALVHLPTSHLPCYLLHHSGLVNGE